MTRPGGWILEPDFETLIIDTHDCALTRRILNFGYDQIVRGGWIGRSLPALLRAAQLSDVTAETWLPTEDILAARLLR